MDDIRDRFRSLDDLGSPPDVWRRAEGPESVRLINASGTGDRTLCAECVSTFLRRSCSECGDTPVDVQPASEALRWSPDGGTLAAPAAQNDQDGLALIDAISGALRF